MKPNTPHYVLTVDHSITYERNFYAISTIRSTCWAIIHTTIGKRVFTNTERPRGTQSLRRILVWSLLEYERVITAPLSSNIHRPASVHRMDPRSVDGLLDIVALGNLLEFMRYLDGRYHTGNMAPSEEAEASYARLVFVRFKGLFCANQHLLIHARRADPKTELLDLSLLRLAVTLIKYKQEKAAFDDAFTPLQLKQGIMEHLCKYYPQLLPGFEHDLQTSREDLPYLRSFDWTGPKFDIAEGPYIDGVSPPDQLSVASCHGSRTLESNVHSSGLGIRKRCEGTSASDPQCCCCL